MTNPYEKMRRKYLHAYRYKRPGGKWSKWHLVYGASTETSHELLTRFAFVVKLEAICAYAARMSMDVKRGFIAHPASPFVGKGLVEFAPKHLVPDRERCKHCDPHNWYWESPQRRG